MIEADKAEQIAAEAYQVIGQLADFAGIFDNPEVQRALDYFSSNGEYDGSILPFGWTIEAKK